MFIDVSGMIINVDHILWVTINDTKLEVRFNDYNSSRKHLECNSKEGADLAFELVSKVLVESRGLV